MSSPVQCPQCLQTDLLSESLVGKHVTCRFCGHGFRLVRKSAAGKPGAAAAGRPSPATAPADKTVAGAAKPAVPPAADLEPTPVSSDDFWDTVRAASATAPRGSTTFQGPPLLETPERRKSPWQAVSRNDQTMIGVGLGLALLAVLLFLLPLLSGGDGWPAAVRYSLAGLATLSGIAAAGLMAAGLRAIPPAAAAAGSAGLLLMGLLLLVSPLTHSSAPLDAKTPLAGAAGASSAAASPVHSGLPVSRATVSLPPPPPDEMPPEGDQQLLTIQDARREGPWQRRVYSVGYARDLSLFLGDAELLWVVVDIEGRSEVTVTGRLQDQGRLAAAVAAKSAAPQPADDIGFQTWMERVVNGRRERISNVVQVEPGTVHAMVADNVTVTGNVTVAGNATVSGEGRMGSIQGRVSAGRAPPPVVRPPEVASFNPIAPLPLPTPGTVPTPGGVSTPDAQPMPGGLPVAGGVVAAGGKTPARELPPEPEGPDRQRSMRYVSLDAHEKLNTALADLRSHDMWRVDEALEQLAVVDPDPARREEVAAVVGELCADGNAWRRERALKAMARWYTPETLPKVIRCVDDPAWWVRCAAIDALSHVKEKNEGKLAAAAIASAFRVEKYPAMAALKRMGPIAEDAVLAEFRRADYWGADDVIDVLACCGTSKSLEKLAPYIRSPDFFVRLHVQRAVKAIQMRRMMK